MLFILERILCLVAHESSRDSAEQAMATHLVAAKVSCSAAAKCTHQTTVTLRLRIGVCGSVALLALCVSAILLSLGILLLRVCALLRKLLRGGLARVLLLSVLALILSILVVGRRTLSMLESSLCRRSVASVLLLLWCLLAVVSTRAALLWLLWILLVIAILGRRGSVTLTRRGGTVLVWRRILLLAVALIVLVVRPRHSRSCVEVAEADEA